MRNEPRDTPAGAVPPAIAVQPNSLPGSLPGKTVSPAFVFAGEYILLTDSSCGCVRQLSVFPSRQRRAAGSNLQARGLFSTPSRTPSCASHADITAVFSIASLAGDTALAGSLRDGTATLKS